MKRALIAPPALAPAALAELKDWLGITVTVEDAGLEALLRAALETCEAFTGLMPIEAECEEVLAVTGGWQALASRPVEAVTGAWSVPADGPRLALAAQDYMIELDADGGALVRVSSAPGRVAVRFTAGLAADWAGLPDGLRHGVLRLAAHHYRERESAGASPVPPAAVAALWRPWRRMRVA